MPEQQVPVLIAGGGTVGLSAALFLAHHGVQALAVERRAGLSIHPRALGIGPRTLEIFRQVGLADPVLAVGGRLAGGSDPGVFLSPAQGGRCSQDLLDEILLAAARKRGAEVRFGAEVIAIEQDAAGVTATLAGGDGGKAEQIRADYLIVADGAGGVLRESLGIPATSPSGNPALGSSMVNILFRADLRAVTRGHEFFTGILANPVIPMGMLMAIDGRERWVLHVPFDPARGETAEDFTPERCRELVRRGAIGELPAGTPEVPVEILSILPWRVAARLADRFRAGRVFLAGDAAHVVPPTGGFGLNSGVADAHNLAWKLAWALRGEAGPALLDSYDAERRPVAGFTLEQALLRLARPDLHWDPSRTAEREALGIANDLVVHLGYRYDSAALFGAEPMPSLHDLALDLDGAPGSRVPHAWLERDGRRVSTLDLGGSGFALLGGPAAQGWCAAAERLGLPAFRVAVDPESDPGRAWHLAAGVGNEGALLVRPDGFVAWRAREAAPAEVGAVLAVTLRTTTGG
jgi:2-polyprenyl-6-methoxyphenol hydroxylase-like FAD-dependent oxidoreductase